jgi:NAD+ synthase
MKTDTELTTTQLALDCEREVSRISDSIRGYLREVNRTGLVVAVSGGIDSSVVLALAAQAVGPNRVIALLMPDKDSSPNSLDLGLQLTEQLGVDHEVRDITPVLLELGCYDTRDEAIKSLIAEYQPDWKWKIVISPLSEDGAYRFFSLVVQSEEGGMISRRLTPKAYLGILAATNFKQRVRKMLEYFHADRLNYAVTGTPNRLEYDQGFFVKLGDGAADIKPIAHLYKSQVYQLGRYLGLPSEICNREPTTDTYSLGQSQEEFYFSVPYQQFDLCLYAHNHGLAPEETAQITGLDCDEVRMVFLDIDRKRKATRYLHMPPVLVEPVTEIEAIQ